MSMNKTTAVIETTTVTVMKPTKVERKTVKLEMTMEQAEVLRGIFNHVGGHPATTARGHVDVLDAALRGAGVVNPAWARGSYSLHGSYSPARGVEKHSGIYFTEASR